MGISPSGLGLRLSCCQLQPEVVGVAAGLSKLWSCVVEVPLGTSFRCAGVLRARTGLLLLGLALRPEAASVLELEDS